MPAGEKPASLSFVMIGAPNLVPPPVVILGLEPRIQVASEAVDGRVKPDHDGGEVGGQW
jgi:hypothetical protein